VRGAGDPSKDQPEDDQEDQDAHQPAEWAGAVVAAVVAVVAAAPSEDEQEDQDQQDKGHGTWAVPSGWDETAPGAPCGLPRYEFLTLPHKEAIM
jgi:hypothetical protein